MYYRTFLVDRTPAWSLQKSQEERVKLNEGSLILKSLVKVEYQLGDSLVLSLLLKIL